VQTEKQKMLAGELYNAADPQLVQERLQARKLLKAYNDSLPEELEKRSQILAGLIGSLGQNVYIEPPFYCDYGSNITLGSSVYFNFGCVVLDVMRVIIGERTLFGPNVQIYTATHPISASERAGGLEFAKAIRIGSDVWVGGSVRSSPVLAFAS
jgi:maltose O-acetyltransferase